MIKLSQIKSLIPSPMGILSMFSKYALVAMGTIILGLLVRVWWLTGDLADAVERVELLLQKNTACNVSQEGLRAKIEVQNKKIKEFNIVLDEKNNVLVEIAEQNEVLEQTLAEEINKIDNITHESCNDTMNWMLEEAIDENTSTSSSN